MVDGNQSSVVVRGGLDSEMVCYSASKNPCPEAWVGSIPHKRYFGSGMDKASQACQHGGRFVALLPVLYVSEAFIGSIPTYSQ